MQKQSRKKERMKAVADQNVEATDQEAESTNSAELITVRCCPLRFCNFTIPPRQIMPKSVRIIPRICNRNVYKYKESVILMDMNNTSSRQDEELDELSLSVQIIGGVGLSIHEELLTCVSLFMISEKSANGHVEGSANDQIMMILGLLALFIFLFILVFFT
ncbi:Syntaxin-61 [Glycine max]|nr:Syntaxin-61 [Glycine max]